LKKERKVGEVGMTRKEAIELLDILPLCNECNSNNFPYTCVECGDAFLLAMEALKQPEIVRCKDCEYWYFADNRITCEQENVCGRNGIVVTPDWFCADGKRKDS
jgi:DNA-directed RNA polymerase subunit RPC12/RpoP